MIKEERIIHELKRMCRIAETITDRSVVKIERTVYGFTNHTYRVYLDDGEKVIVRIAGEGTTEYIDRRCEHYNYCQMNFLGISPKILYCNEDTGDNIARYLEAETMTEEDFQNSPLLRGKAAAAMRQYHQCGLKFANDFSPLERMRQCRKLLADSGFRCDWEGYEEMVQNLDTIEDALKEARIPLVPCHNDPLAANFMHDGDKLYVIDWEFSGMNDCYYDLAAFIIGAHISSEAEEEFLTCYCNRTPEPKDRARLLINKVLVHCFEVYWTLMQLNAGKDGDTYIPFGKDHLSRALQYLNDPFYKEALICIKD